MIFLNRPKFTALAVIALVAVLAACEKDPTTIGAGVIGNEPFNTDKAVFDIFAVNKKIRAVRANQLPIYQLGAYNHPVYGKTEATITSQVRLSTVDPLFGDARPAAETTPENETVDSVYLFIPFLTSPSGDADNDDVIDELDVDSTDPNSDSDGDGLTDNQEKTRGTNPLVADNVEVDGFIRDQFARTFDVDSIYGNRELPFTLNLQRSTYFLRDLDPNTNFQEAQEYYSDQDFSGFLADKISLDTTITISEKQILLPKEDDASTENINEAEQFMRLPPGIRVALDKEFFQENILDKEGGSELLTQANFNNFLRGIHLSLEPSAGEELMMLFNLRDANITISYSYTAGEAAKNKDFVLNFITQQGPSQQGQTFPIVGNAVNSFINDAYAPEIADAIASEENAERIYLKGGTGSFAEINLFDDANGRQAIEQIKANNWIINEANLVFYVDKQPGVIEPPRLYLYNMETNAPLIGRNDTPAGQGGTHFDSYPFYGGLLEGTGSELKYTVKITDYINDLVVRNAENATLGLTITPNIGIFNVADAMLDNDTETELPVAATLSPLGTVLFGSNVSATNTGKKLQLEIFYTEAN
ncbi:DUF4270 family protein [Pricia sp.]|uniref:DUF4270 family protein n=1 Tax=Pricia sp. TaxID=2268138 RepID=UPI00359418B4